MHPIPLFACRTHIHKGSARRASGRRFSLWVFVEVGGHQSSVTSCCPRLPPSRLAWRVLRAAGGRGLCVPGRRGLRAELPEVRPWICSSFRAARGPAAVYDCEGRERGRQQRPGSGLGKRSGWRYTVDGDIGKLNERPQSTSRNSSELGD